MDGNCECCGALGMECACDCFPFRESAERMRCALQRIHEAEFQAMGCDTPESMLAWMKLIAGDALKKEPSK